MPATPKFDPVHRHARVGPKHLPAAGRAGAPPLWPLEASSPAEALLWTQLWATPQAVMWERLGCARVVARYARVLVAAEAMNKDAMSEARQLEDRLGLTPKAMRLLLWTISDSEAPAPAAPRHTARGRIKAVS